MIPVNEESACRRVIAVDIGNTRVKVAAVDSDRGECVTATAFATTALPEELPRAVAELSKGRLGKVPVVLAAVVGPAATVAEDLLRRRRETVLRFSAASLPLTIHYADAASLGDDRLANALYAVKRFPERNVIIVSAGTAIVIDYVANGTFHGGAILPGIRLQMDSLHRATDALPQVELPAPRKIPPLPAMSTKECIAGGVLHGCAAAIDAIIAGYTGKNTEDVPPTVLGTGGDWPLLQTLVTAHVDHHPHATLGGIAYAFSCMDRGTIDNG